MRLKKGYRVVLKTSLGRKRNKLPIGSSGAEAAGNPRNSYLPLRRTGAKRVGNPRAPYLPLPPPKECWGAEGRKPKSHLAPP